MKQFLLLLSVFGIACFAGCKKENTKQEDISPLFKNTEWTGEVKYDNKPFAEPFAVEFFENGTFKWHEFSGDYDGNYSIGKGTREITVHFTASNAQFTASVTQDNKFFNISSSNVSSCELNNSGNQVLDNTIWKNSTGVGLELNFRPGQKIAYYVGYVPYDRIRTALRFYYENQLHFSVLQPDNKTIKGISRGYIINAYYFFSYKLVKQ